MSHLFPSGCITTPTLILHGEADQRDQLELGWYDRWIKTES